MDVTNYDEKELEAANNKDFKVNVKHDKYQRNTLSLTHNGYQWSSLPMGTDNQTEQVIQALNEYMDSRVNNRDKEV